jgi:hypothetical protein
MGKLLDKKKLEKLVTSLVGTYRNLSWPAFKGSLRIRVRIFV